MHQPIEMRCRTHAPEKKPFLIYKNEPFCSNINPSQMLLGEKNSKVAWPTSKFASEGTAPIISSLITWGDVRLAVENKSGT